MQGGQRIRPPRAHPHTRSIAHSLTLAHIRFKSSTLKLTIPLHTFSPIAHILTQCNIFTHCTHSHPLLYTQDCSSSWRTSQTGSSTTMVSDSTCGSGTIVVTDDRQGPPTPVISPKTESTLGLGLRLETHPGDIVEDGEHAKSTLSFQPCANAVTQFLAPPTRGPEV